MSVDTPTSNGYDRRKSSVAPMVPKKENLLTKESLEKMLADPQCNSLFYDQFGHGDNQNWFRSIHYSPTGQRENAIKQDFIICQRCDRLLNNSSGGGTHFTNHRKYACPSIKDGNFLVTKRERPRLQSVSRSLTPIRIADKAKEEKEKPKPPTYLALDDNQKKLFLDALKFFKNSFEWSAEMMECQEFSHFVDEVFKLGYSYRCRVAVNEINRNPPPKITSVHGRIKADELTDSLHELKCNGESLTDSQIKSLEGSTHNVRSVDEGYGT
ncbi:unnamed protein product [Bursaphelenchus xylophilus]|uniref:(pine wood nematode) hypothetical protein n=1 Tax=Bursaphelenchus xylophilus TaxID=6326 RepID=A0A1I7RV82_BURXY|nr:unnamed protein product [Bursaphelenchus xylophilus]CAG9086513.1 unnamed protein product [Bursaphelenchus xylophilus]